MVGGKTQIGGVHIRSYENGLIRAGTRGDIKGGDKAKALSNISIRNP